MLEQPPRDLIRWLSAAKVVPLEEESVPGTREAQRRMLAALGSVVARIEPFPPQDDQIDRWLATDADPPKAVVDATREWLLEGDLDSRVAALYTSVVLASNRRKLGTFFTPRTEATFMVQRWDELYGPPSTVIDVGAGVGVFSALAAATWDDIPIVSVDVNPVTLGLLALRISLDIRFKGRFDLVRADYTEWVTDNRGFRSTSPGALILGNPPYTRAELMPIEERERLHELTNRICGVRAGLATLIVLQSLQQMRPRDGMAQLLPAQWLESDSARGLRDLLWSQQRNFELRLIDTRPFDDATVDAVALFVGPQLEKAETPRSSAGDWLLRSPAQTTRVGAQPTNWRTFAASGAVLDRVDLDTVPLDSLAIVRRGTATGSNRTFVIPVDEAIELGLDSAVLRSVLTKTYGVADDLVEAGALRLLVAREADRRASPALDAYLSSAEAEQIDQRRLCQDRAVWFEIEHDLTMPDVILGSATRDRFRIIQNQANAHITNNLYGFTWREHISSETRKAVVEWLRADDGQMALVRASRHQGTGLIKIEPRAFRNLPIPKYLVDGDSQGGWQPGD